MSPEDAARDKRAKELAAGPLGKKMAEYPMLFAKAAFFGARPAKGQTATINSATVTLVDLGAGPMAVTCRHVVEAFRDEQTRTAGLIFQIGNVVIDLKGQLIAEDSRRDIATIRLTDEQVTIITAGGAIGSAVFKPVTWPPLQVKPGEFVAFGGFPGSLRTVLSFGELVFGSWSSGASEIASANEDRLVSKFEREYWVSSFGQAHQMNLTALGGMSGGPVLIDRGLYWDLVGIVTDHGENFDTMLFATLGSVNPDGTIAPPAGSIGAV